MRRKSVSRKWKENETRLFSIFFTIDFEISIYQYWKMQIQREIERRIEKKRQEIAELKHQLSIAETYLGALQDMAKLIPKDGEKEPVLRSGSDLAMARDFIKSKGQPQHVVEILKGIGKESNKANKISLSGSLGGYVRKGTIFTKPAPNTFGLLELENDEPKTEIDPIIAIESLSKTNY